MRAIVGKPLRRLVTGVTIGGLVGLGAIGSSAGVRVPGVPSVSTAMATGCTDWSGFIARFTGQYQGVSNAGAIQGAITINQPVYVCGYGNLLGHAVRAGRE